MRQLFQCLFFLHSIRARSTMWCSHMTSRQTSGSSNSRKTKMQNKQFLTTQSETLQNETIYYNSTQNKNFKIKISYCNVFRKPSACQTARLSVKLLRANASGLKILNHGKWQLKTIFSNSLIENLKIKNKRCCNA